MSVSQPAAGGSRPDAELRVVAGYPLLRRIGDGGMSTVYQGYDVEGGCPVAVKVLADHLAHVREFVSRFYREGRLSRFLSHPNLIQGLAAGYDNAVSKHYLVLEYVDGPTAHAALGRFGRFPVGVAVQIGIDIARALAFMHTNRFVHRDVKPDNILIHPDGLAKLADLGLAKRLDDDAHLTAVNQNVGTSYYMSYEQSLNATLVDGRSDVFALGATLYHLLAGEVPFPGATHEDVVRSKEGDSHGRLRDRNPLVPPALSDIIDRTLARDPRARYQSAGDLAAALEATGLATRIPPLPQRNDDAERSVAVTESDAPTRTDLASPRLPDPEAGTPTPIPAVGSPLPRVAPLVLAIVAIAASIGLGGALAARTAFRPDVNPVRAVPIASPETGKNKEAL